MFPVSRMPTELRCYLAPGVMSRLDELRGHWGHARRADAVSQAILEAYGKHLARSHWEQQQSHAFRVLKRMKPSLLIAPDEIVGVSFCDGGDRVLVQVALNSAPYQVSRKEWEK